MKIKLFLIAMLAFFICRFQPLAASTVAQDFGFLEQIIEQAFLNLELSGEINSATLGSEPFLQMAELRLKFAQTLSGEPDFLDQDYLNVGLYILSLRFNRYKAALLVLKRQLSVEKEKRLIDWLKNRIQRIEKKIQQPDLDYELEFKNLKKCFSN